VRIKVMTGTRENNLDHLLHLLNSADAGAAWAAFIDAYAGLIMRTVIQFEYEQDRSNECFLYVCEKLYEDKFRRLLTFNTAGKSSFSSWLSTVVFNLCIDWHRKEFGRARMLPAIAALPVFDQRVYQCCYEEQMSAEECYEMLRSEIPGLTRNQIPDALGRIHALLTPRQRWQLSVRIRRKNPTRGTPSHDSLDRIPDPAPAPESLARLQEETEELQDAMSRLTVAQRLLLHLRFREGLTYEQIARTEELGDAHRARRQVQSALVALRAELQRLSARKKRQN
jgi:RNA polymerase sigma factor (sigma-70 family)